MDEQIKEGIHKLKRTVLVVDDELINRELLGVILSRTYDVIYAENGRKAIDIVRRIPGRIRIPPPESRKAGIRKNRLQNPGPLRRERPGPRKRNRTGPSIRRRPMRS